MNVQIVGDRAETETGVDQNAGGTQVNATIQSEGGSNWSNNAIPIIVIGMGGMGLLAVILGAALFTAQRQRVLAWIRERRISKGT